MTDFFVSLAGHARRNRLRDPNTPHGEGLRLRWSEKQVTNHYMRDSISQFDGRGMLARPDGFGCWHERGQTLAFHLEYDTGTESLPRVANKINGYTGDDDYFAPYLDGMILFWLHSSRREQGLRAALARRPTRGRSPPPPPTTVILLARRARGGCRWTRATACALGPAWANLRR